MFVEGFGEADHGLLFEKAALTVKGEAVMVQLRMVVEYEALDYGPPGLHQVTDQTGLTKLYARAVTDQVSN